MPEPRPPPALIFAYDASLHGDWVAHYAIRFAASRDPRRLRLIHVQGDPPVPQLDARLARIATECEVLGVALDSEVVAGRDADVTDRLLALAPPGAIVVTGTRARPRARSFLVGTATARLMAAGRIGVIAMRIVHPGVLGQPNRVLLPIADDDAAADRALPLLHLLGTDLDRVHVALIRERSALRTWLSSADARQRVWVHDAAHLAAVEEALRRDLAPLHPHLDGSMVVTTDRAREVALTAARHHTRLIGVDATLGIGARWPRKAPLEQLLRLAPADVAIYRGLS